MKKPNSPNPMKKKKGSKVTADSYNGTQKSVSITHNSKIRELSDGNHPKPSQTIIYLWDPLVLDDGS